MVIGMSRITHNSLINGAIFSYGSKLATPGSLSNNTTNNQPHHLPKRLTFSQLSAKRHSTHLSGERYTKFNGDNYAVTYAGLLGAFISGGCLQFVTPSMPIPAMKLRDNERGSASRRHQKASHWKQADLQLLGVVIPTAVQRELAAHLPSFSSPPRVFRFVRVTSPSVVPRRAKMLWTRQEPRTRSRKLFSTATMPTLDLVTRLGNLRPILVNSSQGRRRLSRLPMLL